MRWGAKRILSPKTDRGIHARDRARAFAEFPLESPEVPMDSLHMPWNQSFLSPGYFRSKAFLGRRHRDKHSQCLIKRIGRAIPRGCNAVAAWNW